MNSLPEDINTRVRKLYDTGDYYVKIPDRSQGFEKEYWGCVSDPDGKERDLAKEFENSKLNFNYIVEYLKELNPSKLLDIGCGLGALLAAYGSKNNNGNKNDIPISLPKNLCAHSHQKITLNSWIVIK